MGELHGTLPLPTPALRLQPPRWHPPHAAGQLPPTPTAHCPNTCVPVPQRTDRNARHPNAHRPHAAGELPPEFSVLTDMISVDVANNPGLVGCIPASWTTMRYLSSLYIDGTNVSFELPPDSSGAFAWYWLL